MTTSVTDKSGDSGGFAVNGRGDSITNPFIEKVLQAVTKKGVSRVRSGERIDGGDGVHPTLPGRLRHFVGFIHELPDTRTLRIYTRAELDEGVDIPTDEVLYGSQMEPSSEDGLTRDVVVVADGADVIYWSRRSPGSNRDPGGGGGYPYPER